MISKNIKTMDKYELSRWIALLDCITIIDDAATCNKVEFDGLKFNHPAMMHYVDETSDQVARSMGAKVPTEV